MAASAWDVEASAETTAPTPVLIHSGFRVSSTWLWSKFRRLPGTVAYYEAFHPRLAQLGADDVGAAHSASWSSRHPSSAPYFLEFMPLLKPSGGVAGYDARMATDLFIPANGLGGELSVGERDYLFALIEHARRGHKLPVLTFSRSLGRVAAIRRAVEAKHVLVHRNLFHQWASYSGQSLRGNDFFLQTIGATLAACRHDAFLAMLGDAFPDLSLAPDDERTLVVFLVLHLYLYLYAHVVEAADVVVDTTAVATDVGLRRSAERELSTLARVPVDLSDARSSFEASVVSVSDRSRFVDTVEQFTKLITSTCSTERAAAFVVELKDRALGEWDSHDRHTRTSSAWHRRKLDDLQRRVEEQAVGRQAAEDTLAVLMEERDGLTSLLMAARDASEAARTALVEERDSSTARLEAAVAARDASEAARTALAEERDDLATRLSTAAAACGLSEAAQAVLAEDRDRLAALLAAAQAAHAVLAGERDGLAARLSSLTAEPEAGFGTRSSRRARAVARLVRAILRAERD